MPCRLVEICQHFGGRCTNFLWSAGKFLAVIFHKTIWTNYAFVKTSYILWVLDLYDIVWLSETRHCCFQFFLFFRKYPMFGLLDLEDETTIILQNTGDYLPINMVNIPEDL